VATAAAGAPGRITTRKVLGGDQDLTVSVVIDHGTLDRAGHPVQLGRGRGRGFGEENLVAPAEVESERLGPLDQTGDVGVAP
jgi:hypothetical protein